jgi:hypothetical protein
MKIYSILVKYRTRSGIKEKTIFLPAEDMRQALEAAASSVAKRRGVVRVDGAETVEPGQWQ